LLIIRKKGTNPNRKKKWKKGKRGTRKTEEKKVFLSKSEI